MVLQRQLTLTLLCASILICSLLLVSSSTTLVLCQAQKGVGPRRGPPPRKVDICKLECSSVDNKCFENCLSRKQKNNRPQESEQYLYF